ncbi:MAG: hypothetical protein O7D34_05185 [Ignavibacteria bacterium]|nr:hypothetical protein [Ignavibacteria bacterium]
MPENLAPTVLTHRGDTTDEEPIAQANRLEISVWQTLVNERQQRMPVQATSVWIPYVKTLPDKDHTDTLHAFRNTWVHDTLACNWTRVGESFKKLRENLAEAFKTAFISSTRATSETSTLVSWSQAVHQRITSREPSELEWTEAKNQRRCQLVDKEIDGTISVVEKSELNRLQAEMLAYRRKVAPLPLEDLRELHQELLRQARQ